MQTNIQTLHRLASTLLSAVLVVAVFLTAAHAKDLAASPTSKPKTSLLDDQTLRRSDDTATKSLGDLHSHVDKTMVKDPGMNKSFGDNATLTARREREEIEEEQPLSLKMIEMMFMARLTLAYALARA